MILNKISCNDNPRLIAEKYAEMVDSGINSSEILVLAFNALSKKNIIKNIFNKLNKDIISDLKIYTFYGLVYNTINDNWAIIENMIDRGNPSILPNLSGLEVSQLILKNILKEFEVKGYNSKKSLLHQIFRRYSLIVNNNLTNSEISKKSKILKEAFSDDAADIIQKYKLKTLELRSFDYLRQTQIFKYIYINTNYFDNIKYFIAEDADEFTPLIIDFIKALRLKDYFIITNTNGGSRRGYLCADRNASRKLEKIFDEKIKFSEKDKDDTEKLMENIKLNSKNIIKNLTVHSLSKRLDMLDYAVNTINSMIISGIKPTDISIITPIHDKMLKYTLNETIRGCRLRYISGSEKLYENTLVKAVIIVLKLALNIPIDEYELRIIFSKYLNIPIKECKEILLHYLKTNELKSVDFGLYDQNYKKLITLINKLRKSSALLSEKAYYTYISMFKTTDKTNLFKFNFFLKELQDLEKAFKTTEYKNIAQEIIIQAENSIIAENPYSSLDISENDLIIATPQKIIDNKIKTKYQIWLDISSYEWIKPDTGPLYNSQVFQKDWHKAEYTIEDSIEFTKEKTAAVLGKLFNNTEKIIGFSCLFDTQGIENIGGIEKYLLCVNNQNKAYNIAKNDYNIVPREDQKPVLKYKSGQMAISAVPGAGKTTILLALVTKLINKGYNPENIFVLTYMESAARNFKDRIKSSNPDMVKLPNISTIHGLALRIIRENSNFERLNLDADFEICDDTQRGRIIKNISGNISKNDIEDFDRALSVLKLGNLDFEPKEISKMRHSLHLKSECFDMKKLTRFLKFFTDYENQLKRNNLIDYDDILIAAVKLLEQNEDIRGYYQNLCRFIAEDEAQDSSKVQQRLIKILSGKYNNIIRCGDINQAITTTFTNADIEGFRGFIDNSFRVDMVSSQRCSEKIRQFANSLIKIGNDTVKNTFREMYIKPVIGQNPAVENSIHFHIYKECAEEKIETVKTIKNLLKKNPDSTIGILLRNNYQVNNWAMCVNNSGLNAITRNECLAQKTIFKVIFSILKFISEPFNNGTCADVYRALAECGIFKPYAEKIINEYKTDFISLNNDNIQDSDLSRFHWDMNYWLSFSDLSINELALKIGLHYFSDEPSKSNIYLISTLCAKLECGNFAQSIKRLEELSARPSLNGFKFFSETEMSLTNGKIQVMTMHKSKGDEFDYVFIPELSEKNLTLDINKMKLKKSSDFIENIRSLDKNHKIKTDTELKEFLISENFRLLYVGVTRAKRELYFSVSEKEARYGKSFAIEPSIIFKKSFR